MWKILAVASLFFLARPKLISRDEIRSLLRKGLNEFILTGNKSEELKSLLSDLKFPGLFRLKQKVKDDVICLLCRVAMDVVIKARRLGARTPKLMNIITMLCILLKIESEPVCKGAVDINADTISYIIDKTPNLTADRICSIFLQFSNCKDNYNDDWEILIPPKLHNKEKNAYETEAKRNQVRPLRVLQLTDIHYDPDYTIGSNAACNEPLCCQSGTKPQRPEDAAGRWGDYRGCDLPLHVIDASLEHILTKHKDLDYMYYTGDIINHKVWITSIEHNKQVISFILKRLKKAFASIPVFPILGNHEPHPINQLSSDGVVDLKVSTRWLYELIAEEWKDWLPTASRETILNGGYYTALVRPGFRIVALNSNVCYTFNWWLIHDDYDPFHQLAWLVQVLLAAEKNNETVHILSHVPSSDDTCYWNWSREYTKIVNRFADTIAAQFNGHTHAVEHVIYFKDNNYDATNVAFNGGSVTPWTDTNPNYVIYDVHPNTYEVLDYEIWIYNITEANLAPNNTPVWYKLYSFKDAYGVKSLRPDAMAQLAENMAKNCSLAKQYYRFKFRESDPALEKGCDNDCLKVNLCHMVTNYYGNNSQCKYLTSLFRGCVRNSTNVQSRCGRQK